MKAILVLDEMPDNCIKCKIFDHENASCPISWEKFIWGIHDKEMPEYCPLKPLPEKLKTLEEWYEEVREKKDVFSAYAIGTHKGWNLCLDTIMGGETE